jgi:electron transfer flavoprotein alpha subunit
LIALDEAEATSLAAFAAAFGGEYDLVLLTGEGCSDLGASTVHSCSLSEPPTADALTVGLQELARSYRVFAMSATMFGKDAAPRLAATIDRPVVGDVLEVIDASTFVRPMYAGNVLATVKVLTSDFAVTIRSTAFSNAARGGASATAQLCLANGTGTERLSTSAQAGGRPDLTQARVVVSGGRPLKSSETFERLIGGLADKLGGAAGATRAAVDSGIAPNDLQVGQTGKIVAPELYIAAGVSGSTQHVAGMKDSKTIVAINTDPDAPIFDIADFGLVKDLYEAIPEMLELL